MQFGYCYLNFKERIFRSYIFESVGWRFRTYLRNRQIESTKKCPLLQAQLVLLHLHGPNCSSHFHQLCKLLVDLEIKKIVHFCPSFYLCNKCFTNYHLLKGCYFVSDYQDAKTLNRTVFHDPRLVSLTPAKINLKRFFTKI